MKFFKKLSRSVKGRVAIITGAGSGMGEATAKVFASEGVKVLATDINLEGIERVSEEIKSAKNPILILGGSVWSNDAAKDLEAISEMLGLTILTSHRRQSFYNNLHSNYGGDLGLGVNPKLIERINKSDYLVLLGGRLSENPSSNNEKVFAEFTRQELKLGGIYEKFKEGAYIAIMIDNTYYYFVVNV